MQSQHAGASNADHAPNPQVSAGPLSPEAQASGLCGRLTDILTWACNARELAAMLDEFASDRNPTDRELGARVEAVMEAVHRNLALIAEAALTGHDEASRLAASLHQASSPRH